MLDIFYDSKSFFQEKEIEAIASKQKGVRDGKDILKLLLDDDLVLTVRNNCQFRGWRLSSRLLSAKLKAYVTV